MSVSASPLQHEHVFGQLTESERGNKKERDGLDGACVHRDLRERKEAYGIF